MFCVQEFYEAKSGRVRMVREGVGQLLTVVGAMTHPLLPVLEPCVRELSLPPPALRLAQTASVSSADTPEDQIALIGVFAGTLPSHPRTNELPHTSPMSRHVCPIQGSSWYSTG